MFDANRSFQFLKLGGSLITDKSRPHTPRPELLRRLASEVAMACDRFPGMKLLLGHGSGSFGHVPARRYQTRQGVRSAQEWQGFVEVWREAASLNHLVVEAFGAAGLPVMAFPPSASLTARDGHVQSWNLDPLQLALQSGLLPVVYGDVVFDQERGGTIFSTEDLFDHLARRLRPERILLAGLEAGVWVDYPRCTELATEITSSNLGQVAPALGGSAATDVTGGMLSKVQQSLALAQAIPGLQVRIFSGEIPGMVVRALQGEPVGTLIHAGWSLPGRQ
jgi:isopentenyl phosphate kinase